MSDVALLRGSQAAHTQPICHGHAQGSKQPANNIMGSGHVTPTAKNTGGGRPPKRLFLGLGSRLAASLRSPDALTHAPTTPRTPTSRASVKDRDSTVVMEPDGRQIDTSSAALRLRPNNPLDSLTRCCPQHHHGAGLDRRHWPRTNAPQPLLRRAGGYRLPGAARVLAKGVNHAPACKKKNPTMVPNRPRAPPQRPRAAASPHPHQVHCTYHSRGHRQHQQRLCRPEMVTSRPRNPWRGRGAAAQVRPRALCATALCPSRLPPGPHRMCRRNPGAARPAPHRSLPYPTRGAAAPPQRPRGP